LAFLLSEKAVPRGKRQFYSLVGYLPIGMIVAIDDQKTKIYSTKTDQSDTYVTVHSELGLTGLLRRDLFVEFGDRPIIVPIGLEEIQFYRDDYAPHDKPSDCKNSKKCFFFSRNDDVHLEVTDESHESYYGVTLYRHRQVRDYPMQENGWVSRRRVGRDRDLKKINPAGGPINMPSWRPVAPEEETLQQKIVDEVGDRFDDLGQLLCQTSAAVEADAGVRILGSGVVFKVDAKLKEQGMFRLLEGYVIDSGDKEIRYRLSRDIVCENSSPVRMSRLILEEKTRILEEKTRISGGPVNSDQLLLKDLENTNSQWILSFQGKVRTRKWLPWKPGNHTTQSAKGWRKWWQWAQAICQSSMSQSNRSC
jgi:hypothetical protein